MGFEIVIFGILVFLMFTGGLARLFHHKPKELSERAQTTSGLINLFLGTIALYYLLQLAGVTV